MPKRTVFTTLTPLPPSITRETVMETLHSHTEMIDLNPLVEERHPIKPPPHATPEEYACIWYSLTDRVSYLPGGLMNGKVTYSACFHDLKNGLQTHCYAPMGLNIRGKWTLGGSLPGEPVAPIELGLGAPISGLYLREDVDMRCNIMMTSFVKKTLKKAHSHLVERLLIKAQIAEAAENNRRIMEKSLPQQPHHNFTPSQASMSYSPTSDFGDDHSEIDDMLDQRHPSMAPPIPLAQHSPSFSLRVPDKPDLHDKTSYEDMLYPKGLTVRSSSASYNGSSNGAASTQGSGSGSGSQDRRTPYPDPPIQRVSWQNLNTNTPPAPAPRSPQPAYAEPALREQQPPQSQQQYRSSSAHSFHTAPAPAPAPASMKTLPQTTYHQPPNHDAAELE